MCKTLFANLVTYVHMCYVHYMLMYICMKAQALSTVAPEQMAEVSAGIADSLVTVTEPVENTSALPLDLGTTVDILDSIIR